MKVLIASLMFVLVAWDGARQTDVCPHAVLNVVSDVWFPAASC